MIGATMVRPKMQPQPPLPLPKLTVKVGNAIKLVRWFPEGEGWGFETVEGRYGGIREGAFLVESGGLMTHCPADEWQEFRP